MSKLLKDLEYLIPLLAGMPNWVKGLVILWVVLTIFLLFTIASITYTKNKEKALKEKTHTFEVVKTQINRLIQDYDLSSKNIVDQFPKDVNQINSGFNARGVFHSGMRIKQLWEIANEYKEKFDVEYRNLARKVEDILLENIRKKDINSIPQLNEEAQRINKLHVHYENHKKKFEEPARKADSSMNKNNPIINEKFEIK